MIAGVKLWLVACLFHMCIGKSIIGEGEYPTSLWYRVNDLCNDIHKQSGFTVCPSTSHTSCSCCSGVYMQYRLASMPTNNKL